MKKIQQTRGPLFYLRPGVNTRATSGLTRGPLFYMSLAVVLLLAFAVLVDGGRVAAQEAEPDAEAAGAPMHPAIPLLDAEGEHVLSEGAAVSTMTTCGACHDTAFIAGHSFHADVGLSGLGTPGSPDAGLPWDTSPGLFGKWNPLTYRYLSPAGDSRVDLTTPEWVQLFGARHVGGGPAIYSRDVLPLTETTQAADSPETQRVNPETGAPEPWDWQASGTVEMNCFLCHTGQPNNEARTAALQSGAFSWAATATLSGSGLVEGAKGDWRWNADAFDAQGNVAPSTLDIQDPSSANCGACHGVVEMVNEGPVALGDLHAAEAWTTRTTGQVYSGERLLNSALNLEDKASLSRPWDVHAERALNCSDCHYSLNNPIYFEGADANRPDHLLFDPRRLDLGDYLYRPLHEFAKGQSAQGTLAPELDNSLRRCESCHDVAASHQWLPYKERHTAALSCESCHAPALYAPAQESIDWTVLTVDGTAAESWRGSGSDGLITGYEPALLARENGDGGMALAPYNLIASWYWIYGEPARPAPLRDLRAAWLDGDAYAPEVLAAFDGNGDGRLGDEELRIDTGAKEALIAGRLEALGLDNPRISGSVQPYSINHSVATGEWATKECTECHGSASRVTRPMRLAGYVPGGVLPTLLGDDSTQLHGELQLRQDGTLYYQPQTNVEEESGLSPLYILGHNSVDIVDWAGLFIFVATVAGASAHAGMRYFAARRHPPKEKAVRQVYLFGVYERLWHWLQTLVIFGLLFTGLIIHKPDQFGIFAFRYVVQVHNVLAAILVANAALSAFYHLASGEIQQFLPRPRGFFDHAFAEAKYYLQGIFRGEPLPFKKTRRQKLNPLQQATYFVLLNVLLPLQALTGIFMWGAQRWPSLTASLGGLPFLAPLHTMVAWLLASFIVMHVYLTTTGRTPTTYTRAMITGWDEVEVVAQSGEAKGVS